MSPQDRPATAAHLPTATIDLDRRRRCGYPEVVFGPGKTIEQLCQIVATLIQHGEPILATRIDTTQAAGLLAAFPQGKYNQLARTFRIADEPSPSPSPKGRGMVAVISPAPATCLSPRKPAKRSIGWASR